MTKKTFKHEQGTVDMLDMNLEGAMKIDKALKRANEEREACMEWVSKEVARTHGRGTFPKIMHEGEECLIIPEQLAQAWMGMHRALEAKSKKVN